MRSYLTSYFKIQILTSNFTLQVTIAMKILSFCNKVIEFSFYTLLFLVPLAFSGSTSELFEFNKMWLTFGMTIVIATAWLTKMTIEKRVVIQRTPLDIPVLLFLLSQIISTLFSLDQHVSFWGYYSRFNGGLLSMICYVLLYYAFVSNLSIKHVFKSLVVSLLAGLAVSLWGVPSHFGADPTCLVFRGNFDTSCWTYQFQPTIRAFSTLGQPAWLAAYLALLLPLSMGYALKQLKVNTQFWLLLALSVFFYLCLIFANTRAGFIAFGIADVILWVLVIAKKLVPFKFYLRALLLFHVAFLVSSFFFGIPIGNLANYSLSSLVSRFHQQPTAQQQQAKPEPGKTTPSQTSDAYDPNITDSGQIRLLVWKGALDAWRNNPLFGTGVETFAFAYYKFRPPEHNLTSEWDYLYNKAHNEYLNYLTTTGLFGLGSYVAMILVFLGILAVKYVKKTKHEQVPQHAHDTHELRIKRQQVITLGLVSGYLSILISNFLGFSVVIINLYLFLIPAFVFFLNDLINPAKTLVLPVKRKTGAQNKPLYQSLSMDWDWTVLHCRHEFGLRSHPVLAGRCRLCAWRKS
jgi:putative inorganic carbon (HCO3(-)) transporter